MADKHEFYPSCTIITNKFQKIQYFCSLRQVFVRIEVFDSDVRACTRSLKMLWTY